MCPGGESLCSVSFQREFPALRRATQVGTTVNKKESQYNHNSRRTTNVQQKGSKEFNGAELIELE